MQQRVPITPPFAHNPSQEPQIADTNNPRNSHAFIDDQKCAHEGSHDQSLKEKIQKAIQRKIETDPARHSFKTKKAAKKMRTRNRLSFQALKVRYCDPGYAAQLVRCDKVISYDSGAEPTCCKSCSYGCKLFFNKDENYSLLQEAIQDWWGAKATSSSQQADLYQDVLQGYNAVDQTQHWFIKGKEVCKNFYCRTRGKHRTVIEACQRDFLQQKTSYLHAVEKEHKNSGNKHTDGILRDQITAWLEIFAKHVGDKMPHEKMIVLPYREISAVYEEYVDDMNVIKENAASQSYFGQVFNACCNDSGVRLCRDTGTFVTCTVCDAYHIALRAAKSPAQRIQLKALRRRHLTKQRIQREKYYKHKLKAMMSPHKYLSIIMDGMDQKKTDCPVVGRNVKDESPLGQRIIGVKVHGIANYCYVVDDSVPGGTNLMIEILNRVLQDLDSRGMLPSDPEPVFYLQVDNCGENKNRTMFAYLTDLVKRNIFHKVKACFLMVGHTHEDIDQFFSVISKHLKQVHITCPDQQTLLKEVANAFQNAIDRPEVLVLSALDIFDYKRLYDPVLDPDLAYHQEPHQFRIKTFLSKESKLVLVHYKQWAQSLSWLPLLPTVSLSEHPDNQPRSPKRRKMSRHSTTKGQMIAKVKEQLLSDCSKRHVLDHCEDIPENRCFDNEHPLVVNEQSNMCPTVQLPVASIRGILWIRESPSLSCAPRLVFDDVVIERNIQWSQKVYDTIRTTFATKYRSIFTDQVINNWKLWFEQQQQIWNHGMRPSTSTLNFPRPLSCRVPIDSVVHENEEVEDCALEDLGDSVEFLTFSNFDGKFGQFTKQDRMHMVRLTLAEITSHNSKQVVLENRAGIYKFTHVDRETQVEKVQIAVGIVTKVHTCPITENLLYDIKFCPPKGAKPAKKGRADTLYQDISADMAFNVNYKSRVGRKVENEDVNLPRKVMLAFNLELNKSDGKFCKKRRNDSIYNASSYMLAENVIREFYENKNIELS